jgi:hypothetical protein
LWLTIAVELRPSPEEIAKTHDKAEDSLLLRTLAVYLRVGILLMGTYSLLALVGVVAVLSGVFEPTLGWAFLAGIAVLLLAVSALSGLVETAMKIYAPVIIKKRSGRE